MAEAPTSAFEGCRAKGKFSGEGGGVMNRWDRQGLAWRRQGGRRQADSTCKAPKQERAWFMEGVKEVQVHCSVDGRISMERLTMGKSDRARAHRSL